MGYFNDAVIGPVNEVKIRIEDPRTWVFRSSSASLSINPAHQTF